MVYSDVVKNNWILPYKNKYTMRDFNKLHVRFDAMTARFIVICSAAFWCTEKNRSASYSNVFDNIYKFLYMAD